MQFDWHAYHVSNRTRTGAKRLFFLQGFRKTDAFLLLCGGSAGLYCAMFERLWHHHSVLIILKILMLTRKRDAFRPLRLCWPHAGRAHTFGIAPKVRKIQNPIGMTCQQKKTIEYGRTLEGWHDATFRMPRRHHLLIFIILKIQMLTRKRDTVRPLRLCWPHAGRAHTFGIAPKVRKNSRPLQCNSIGMLTMLAIEPEPEQKGCFSYKDSEKLTPFCSFAVDRPGFIVLFWSVFYFQLIFAYTLLRKSRYT